MPHTLSPLSGRPSHATAPAGPSSDAHADIAAHIRRETITYQDHGTSFRRWGGLKWLENPGQTSLESRLAFISALANHIKSKPIQRDQPLTFVSLGSGQLLTECYIHRLLTAEGYGDIHWRLIDVCYRQAAHADLPAEFKRKTGATDVLAFLSEQEYLKSAANGYGLANNDRNSGTTVVLSINSPEDPDKFHRHNDDADCLRFRPTRLRDAGVSNSLFFMISTKKYKDDLDETLKNFMDGHLLVGDNILRCALNHNNQLRLHYPNSHYGKFLFERLRPNLNTLYKSAADKRQPITLSELDDMGNRLAKELSEGNFCLVKFFASDYDVSLMNLQQYSQEGASSLFAALDWNETRFQ